MPYTKRVARRNIWPFGSKPAVSHTKCARRSNLTVPAAIEAAYKAGAHLGDTGLFRQWLCERGLQDRGAPLIRRLKLEFEEGVHPTPKPKLTVPEETTSPAPAPSRSAKGKKQATYKGYRIIETADGSLASSLDPDSHFDSMIELQRHIDDYLRHRNPGRQLTSDQLARAFEHYEVPVDHIKLAAKHMQRAIDRYGADNVFIYWIKGQETPSVAYGDNNTIRFDIPYPQLPDHLFAILHEVGHALLHGPNTEVPANQEEYEANAYAFDALAAEGIQLPSDDRRRWQKYICRYITKDRAKGARIDARAVEMCEAAKNYASNPHKHLRTHLREGLEDYDAISGAIWKYTGGLPSTIGHAVLGSKNGGRMGNPYGEPTRRRERLAYLVVRYDRASVIGYNQDGTAEYEPKRTAVDNKAQALKEGKRLARETGDRVEVYDPSTHRVLWESKTNPEAGMEAMEGMETVPSEVPVFQAGPEGLPGVVPITQFTTLAEAVAYAQAVKGIHPGVCVLTVKGAGLEVHGVCLDVDVVREADEEAATMGVGERNPVDDEAMAQRLRERLQTASGNEAKEIRALLKFYEHNGRLPALADARADWRGNPRGRGRRSSLAPVTWGPFPLQVEHFHPRFVKESDLAALSNMWHLSRVPHGNDRYQRLQWTADNFAKEHPEYTRMGVYKDLTGMLEFGHNPRPGGMRTVSMAEHSAMIGDPHHPGPYRSHGWATKLDNARRFQKQRARGAGEIVDVVDSQGKHITYSVVEQRGSENPRRPVHGTGGVTHGTRAKLYIEWGGQYDVREYEWWDDSREWLNAAGNRVLKVKKNEDPGVALTAWGRKQIAHWKRRGSEDVYLTIDGTKVANPGGDQPDQLSGSDLEQYAFEQGKQYRLSGDYYTSGVSNANVVRYGFRKLYLTPRGTTQARLMKAFREGYNAGKRMEKRNPGPAEILDSQRAADDLYEDFHGRPATEHEDVVTEIIEPTHLTVLGTMVSLVVETINRKEVTIGFEDDPPYLASSPDGTQLYFQKGSQSVDLKAMGLDGDEWERQLMVLGDLTETTYRTQKAFDKFRTIDYYHANGEEKGIPPQLLYDPINKLLSVAGGTYKVLPEGIVD